MSGLEVGAVDFLTKSRDEDALMRAVDAALARAHVLRKEAEDAASLQARHPSMTPCLKIFFVGPRSEKWRNVAP
ncbi:hypothetical protein ABQJ48_15035 [Paraburkholderia sp. DGU8]